VPVTVSLRGFAKTYRLDLIVNGMLYELKAVERLAPAHDAQVYHYGALIGTDRVKLLDFGGLKVEGLLRRCPFPRVNRFAVEIERARWRPIAVGCETLARDAEECLREWGGFLDAHLFEEALLHFNGGAAGCERRVPVTRDGLALGHHRVAMHGERVAFVVTSLDDTKLHEGHLRSLLGCLPLQAWQWINVRGTMMRMVTVER
jgi:hypothetical protein